jgi:hypothetical protein
MGRIAVVTDGVDSETHVSDEIYLSQVWQRLVQDHGYPTGTESTSGAEWLLTAIPDKSGSALVIGSISPAALVILQKFFASVSLWIPDAPYAALFQDFVTTIGCSVTVRHVGVPDLTEALLESDERWSFVALIDALPLLKGRTRDLVALVRSQLTNTGQCCIVSGVRESVARVAQDMLNVRHLPLAFRIVDAIRNAEFEHSRILYPYPDHIRVTELLGWRSGQTDLVRSRLVRVLQIAGLGRFTHNSVIALG